ncbi:MAG: phosphatidylserine decarboxylase [Elusimicrobiota bacterium]
MKKTKRFLAEGCRIGCYASFSYFWLGLLILAMLRQAGASLLLGLTSGVFLLLLAKGLGAPAWSWPRRFAVALAFILAQCVLWRYYYFFRDPERTIPEGPVVVSPADGFVVYVRPVERGAVPLAVKNRRSIPLEEILRLGGPGAPEEGWLVGIFMTPLSVHVNRSPVAGVVERRYYHSGSRLGMLTMSLRTIFRRTPYEAGSPHVLENERETLLIQGDVPVYLTRIADPYVDKIVTWKREGEAVARGERLGLIKMGSQADLVLPARAHGRPVRIRVEEGQYVRGGSTVLADY